MIAVLLGVFAALCWSMHDVIARSIAGTVGGFRTAAWVMVSGFILLSAYVLWDGSVWQATPSAVFSGLLLGFAYGFGVGGLFKAFSLGPVSLVGPLTAGYPVLAVLWGVFNGLELTVVQWACVGATLLGAVIVARSGEPDGGINAVAPGKLPVLLFFAAMSVLGYSSSIVLGQQAALSVGEVDATWLSRPVALLVLLPFAFLDGKHPALTRNQWIGIFVMGALDVLGVIAVSASGHFPGKELAGIGVSAYGALSVLMAMIFLKEKVSPGQWVGMAMTVGAVATMSIGQG